MRRGRPTWTKLCGGELLRRVQEAIDARDESPRAIFDRLNLRRFTTLSTFRKWVAVRRRDRESRTAGGDAALTGRDAGPTVTGRDAGPTGRFGFNQTGPPPGSSADGSSDSGSPSCGPDSTGPTGRDAGPTPLPAAPLPALVIDLVIAQCVEAISEAMAAGRIGKLDVGKALRSLAALKELSIAEAAEKRAQEIHEVKLADLRRKQAAALDEVSQATGLTDEQLGQIKARVLGI